MSGAARSVGRDPAEVRLVAVSKTFDAEHVRAAAAAGQVEFGENRVQEAEGKIDLTRDLSLTWHLVGHLQSKKSRKAAALFDCVQSVDRPELVRRLDAAAREQGAHVELLLQVDLAGEPTKHGATPDAIRRILDEAASLTNVRLRGLMLLPPFASDPEAARPYFKRLRALRDELIAAGYDPNCLRELSMGMSHDFEIAVQEGSTIVRVGTAIFGERPT